MPGPNELTKWDGDPYSLTGWTTLTPPIVQGNLDTWQKAALLTWVNAGGAIVSAGIQNPATNIWQKV